MKCFQMEKNIQYWEMESYEELFDTFADFLKDGADIGDFGFGFTELIKEDKKYILSLEHIDNPDKTVKQKLIQSERKCKIVYPDYTDTFLNVISEIRKVYGKPTYYPCSELGLEKDHKIIILVLDGLGENILKKNLGEDSFLRTCYVRSVHSIFPSTTAAATTAIKTGKSPLVTGWTGWENYIKEINRNVVLFTGNIYQTGESTGVSGYHILPYTMFYEEKGICVEPDFSKKEKLNSILKRSLKYNQKTDVLIQYVYYTEPDSTMHKYGAYSKEAKDILKRMDDDLRNYAKRLKENTTLIITADHGHIDVEPIPLFACGAIMELLNRVPSNDSRCLTFSVRKGKEKEFEMRFKALFYGKYNLYKTEEAIALGFFGKKGDSINERCKDFLADYVAIAISKYYFEYVEKKERHLFKSHHAGITQDEMLVPICMVKR